MMVVILFRSVGWSICWCISSSSPSRLTGRYWWFRPPRTRDMAVEARKLIRRVLTWFFTGEGWRGRLPLAPFLLPEWLELHCYIRQLSVVSSVSYRIEPADMTMKLGQLGLSMSHWQGRTHSMIDLNHDSDHESPGDKRQDIHLCSMIESMQCQ